jgi:CheY-like chemotaxis protein
MMLRPDHPESSQRPGSGQVPQPGAAGQAQAAGGGSRLNLLLSCAGWRRNTALDQLPQLLTPMGIFTLRAESGEEAADVIRTYSVHIAVVDLSIPLHRTRREPEKPGSAGAGTTPEAAEAGPRVLQLLRRLEQPPPTVVVRSPQPALRESARGLTEALREGAFAVLDQPVNLESMLEVLRRILRRHYADVWPA